MSEDYPTVWHSMLSYKDNSGRVRMARRGEPAVNISPDARKRAERLGAFDPPEKQGQRDVSLVSTLTPIGGVQSLDDESSFPAAPVVTGDPGAPTPQPPGPDADDDTNPAQTDGAGRPAQTAPKDAWVEFAVSQGKDRVEAEAMTKAELVSAYKG